MIRRLTSIAGAGKVANEALSFVTGVGQVANDGLSSAGKESSIVVAGKSYPRDTWTNASGRVLSKLNCRLHAQENHPLHTLKTWIQDSFQSLHPYSVLDSLDPIVSTKQNFDDLLIGPDHPGRSMTDTYYINQDTVLRTHTSAHQSTVLSSKKSNAYLLTADVYRRDEIDTSHYPVFHQMEGIRLFDRDSLVKQMQDPFVNGIPWDTPLDLSSDNQAQSFHSETETRLVAHHLRQTLEHMMRSLFQDPNLKIRWVQTYFPFTQPSWEAEIWYNNDWLEVMGCGVIRQEILEATGNSDKVGWAFGLGLERLAMILFDIPDIRLFWSQDARFLNQFSGKRVKFEPFSKYPACYKDISFWCPSNFHENDLMELVGSLAGDLAESVKLIDTFVHPKTSKQSRCYRIQYRSMERTLQNAEIDSIQDKIRDRVASQLMVELR